MTDFQRLYKIEEKKKLDEYKINETEEIMILKDIDKVCVIITNYILR